MSTYAYTAPSPISEVIVRRTDDRAPVALLAASDPAKAPAIREALTKHGWQCVAVIDKGHDLLQVSGFQDDDALLGFLQSARFTQGVPTVREERAKAQEADGFQKFFDRYSLQLAGVLNLIGDVALFRNGMVSKDNNKFAAGALYTAGGANLTLFGKGDPNAPVRDVSEQTAAFIQQEIGQLPHDSALNRVAEQRETGTVADAKRFLQKHPAQVTLVPYIGGAVAMLMSGIKHAKATGEKTRLYSGVSSVFFKTASFLIPESSHKNEDSNENSGGLIGWIREKPLRLFGYGSFITDLLMSGDAYKDFSARRKGWQWIGLTSASYLMADIMVAISHKDPNAGALTSEEQMRVEAMAAEAIHAAPEEARPALTEKVAGFLRRQPQMRGSSEMIQRHLRMQLEHLDQSAWVKRTETSAEPAVAQHSV